MLPMLTISCLCLHGTSFSSSSRSYSCLHYYWKVLLIQPIKFYIYIYVCFSTKAAHIEIVTHLTSEAYIAALTCFSRRGVVSETHSNNALNLVRAVCKLRFIFNELTQHTKFSVEICLQVSFIPTGMPQCVALREKAIQVPSVTPENSLVIRL